MRRKLTKNEYVLSAIFAFIAAFPLATSADGQWFGIEPLASLTQRERMQIADDRRDQARLIAQVRAECEKRMKQDPETTCPNVNDTALVRRFLRGQDIAPVSGSGSTERTQSGSVRTPILDVLDLSPYEQSLLRRFRRNGSCPANLDNVLPGFQRLCAKEVRQAPHMLRGIMGR